MGQNIDVQRSTAEQSLKCQNLASGSISNQEFGYSDRGNGRICFQSGEQLQD